MNAVELTNVLKRFSNGNGSDMTILFENMDFSVREGELVVVSGNQGSGKSTLLQMIAAMTPANKGTVNVFGEDLLSVHKRTEWRLNTIGFINADSCLIPYLSARQNLLIGLKKEDTGYEAKQAHATAILSELGFSEETMDESIEALDDKQQLLATIGRIFMTQPKLILADEPAKALKGEESEELLTRLIHFSRQHGLTVIIATNDSSIIKKADRHVVVENHRLVEYPIERTCI
ncbi:ATP-binding cassette domain-containing protein [Salipaludibacillus agaradhaerens]|uniref:ATP-binding cassette domain-containing protein n=1 Tax=Salipaludibacillus agaradhaerens TaxID=76935 RepID=UPI002150F59B|nr:ATP-binding cassette domain-containing protein [Salipaludibacillus agaradhaerens]MCR6107248.1 ATP-binding cassette domain-containing protein [Salipaludibacillus agaradhaerens]MCR6119277.1 ATP-binding cassette domain-containing protein [Salipaludibacillus agaradhaerens]